MQTLIDWRTNSPHREVGVEMTKRLNPYLAVGARWGHGISRKRRSAFTLIELLVVISIIALLIAILLPALSSAKQSAIRIECLGRAQQAVVASTSYAVDSDNRFLPGHNVDTVGAPVTGIKDESLERFEDYGFAPKQWICPDWDPKVIINTTSGNGETKIGYIYLGGVQWWRGKSGWGVWNGPLQARSPITLDDATSEVAMVTDVVAQFSPGSWALRASDTGTTREFWSQTPAHGQKEDREPIGSNHAFADGSGQWIEADWLMPLHNYGNNRQTLWYQKDIGEAEAQGYLTPP